MRIRMWGTGLVVAVVLAGNVSADRLITMQVEAPAAPGSEVTVTETYTIWVGDSRLREDRKTRSTIVDRATGKLYVIDHTDKTYYAIDLPVDFDSLVPPHLRQQWRAVLFARKPKLTIRPGTGTATLRGFEVTRHEAVLTDTGGATMNLTMWNTADPGFDVETYKQLMFEILALQPSAGEWIRELFDLGGYPVRMERAFDSPDGRLVSGEEVVSIEDKKAPAQTWKPAEGYTETEFSLLSAPPR